MVPRSINTPNQNLKTLPPIYLFLGKAGSILLGYPCITLDLDCIAALRGLYFHLADETEQSLLTSKDVVQIKDGPFDADIFHAPNSMKPFSAAKSRRILEDICPIASKEVSNRRKDLADIELLVEFPLEYATANAKPLSSAFFWLSPNAVPQGIKRRWPRLTEAHFPQKYHDTCASHHTLLPIIMSSPSPDTPTIITREEIMFFDTDCGGVVHNIAYLRMIETARTRLAAKLGMALREMAETQLFPVVVRTEIDYRKPARLGDEITIHGRLEKVERVRFWCAFEVRREADEQLLITCRQSLALVQMPQGRPQRLPEDWAGKYAHLVG